MRVMFIFPERWPNIINFTAIITTCARPRRVNVIIPDGGNPERKVPGPYLNHVGPGGAAHLPDAERRPLGGVGPRALLASVLHLQQVFVQDPHPELLDGVPDQPDGAGHGHAAAGVLRVARSGRVRV